MGKVPDISVVIPYKTLQELLESAQMVNELRQELQFRDQQILALRKQMSEVIDVIGQIRQELRSYQD